MKVQLRHSFEDIISVDNLLSAWQEFVKGKRWRKDVQEFSFNLMDNIFELHNDLVCFNYKHGNYIAFNIFDPKPRNIHKATVRDRLLHHAIYRILYPFFDKTFISDSFSCRLKKGTHKAINRFYSFGYKVSQNNTKTCWVLKCDIKKFFANIDHKILIDVLSKYIIDDRVLWLLERVIYSFSSARQGIGLPLGNLTSQLFVNIYMNEFDKFVKHKLKAKYYIRYADDFVIFSKDKKWFNDQIYPIKIFLFENLKLHLHPKKVFIKTLSSGIDFLGWINFSNYRVLRTSTKRRMLKRINKNPAQDAIISYLVLLSHGNAYKLSEKIKNLYMWRRMVRPEGLAQSCDWVKKPPTLRSIVF